MRKALAFAALAVAFGCSEKTPAAPTTGGTSVSGIWAGPLLVEDVPTRMSWELTQAQQSVTGPVTVTVASGTVLMNGFLTGTIAGSALSYTISIGAGGVPSRPTCAGQFTGTMQVTFSTPSTLIGPMALASSNCTPPLTGATLTLTKP